MTVSVYMDDLARQRLSPKEQTSLKENFELYKGSGAASILGRAVGSPYFGKEELLTQPSEVRGVLYKVHIKPDSPKQKVKDWLHQTSRGLIPTSDHIMIYAQGVKDHDAYVILDILRPDGHAKMLNFEHLRKLKVVADAFRQQF